jgi:DNA-binding CsgD family transcriptional regulator
LKRTRDEQSVRALDAALRRRFSFTPSEAKVALLILEGLTYAEMAKLLGVSYHTVHTHIKAIHAKARVASNSRLQALIRSIGTLK